MLKLKNIKLLVVDDSIVARMAVKRLLSDSLASISEAPNGAAAIEMLKTTAFDCIFIDYLMPGLNGMTTLKIIREMGVDTPVIIISANQQESIIAKFKEMKVSAILKKHVDKAELLNALANAVKSEEDNG